MSNIFEQFMPSNLNSMSWDNLKLNLTPSVKSHLKKVYTNMAVMLAISAFTCYLDIIGLVSFNYTLTSLAALICLAAFAMTDEITSKDTAQYLLYGFAALKGFSLAPLISLAIDMDSSIIFTALVSTALVFISFSLSVMYSVNRQSLYITGFLSTSISSLFWLSFANRFIFQSSTMFSLELYLGLAVFSMYVIYDTQVMIMKFEQGSKLYMRHTMELYIDLVALFVRLMVLLMKKKETEEEKKNKKRR